MEKQTKKKKNFKNKTTKVLFLRPLKTTQAWKAEYKHNKKQKKYT